MSRFPTPHNWGDSSNGYMFPAGPASGSEPTFANWPESDGLNPPAGERGPVNFVQGQQVGPSVSASEVMYSSWNPLFSPMQGGPMHSVAMNPSQPPPTGTTPSWSTTLPRTSFMQTQPSASNSQANGDGFTPNWSQPAQNFNIGPEEQGHVQPRGNEQATSGVAGTTPIWSTTHPRSPFLQTQPSVSNIQGFTPNWSQPPPNFNIGSEHQLGHVHPRGNEQATSGVSGTTPIWSTTHQRSPFLQTQPSALNIQASGDGFTPNWSQPPPNFNIGPEQQGHVHPRGNEQATSGVAGSAENWGTQFKLNATPQGESGSMQPPMGNISTQQPTTSNASTSQMSGPPPTIGVNFSVPPPRLPTPSSVNRNYLAANQQTKNDSRMFSNPNLRGSYASMAGQMWPPFYCPWPREMFFSRPPDQLQPAIPPNLTLNVNQVIANRDSQSDVTSSATFASRGEIQKRNAESSPFPLLKSQTNGASDSGGASGSGSGSGGAAGCSEAATSGYSTLKKQREVITPPSSPEEKSSPLEIDPRKFLISSSSSSDEGTKEMLAIEWKKDSKNEAMKSDSSLSSDFEVKKKKRCTKKKGKQPPKKRPCKTKKLVEKRTKKDDDDDDNEEGIARNVEPSQDELENPEKLIIISSDEDNNTVNEISVEDRPLSPRGGNSPVNTDTEDSECRTCKVQFEPLQERGENLPCGCKCFCVPCAAIWKFTAGDGCLCPKCFKQVTTVEAVGPFFL